MSNETPILRRAGREDCGALAELAARMWSASAAELETEFAELTESRSAACFLAETDGRAAAFAQCGLRHDYVEGTHSSPVGYLEGIYVLPEYRKRGVASALLRRCEAWAREQGCTEFASDCELTNDDSLRFHLALGFAEANRIICFKKRL